MTDLRSTDLAGEGQPVTLVAVHGTGGEAAEVEARWLRCWRRFGRRPLRLRCPQLQTPYQFLLGPAGGPDAGEAVLAAVGGEGDRLCLHGFSGGAQFAHRLAMRHPGRVACCVALAAGSWTAPDGGWTGMMAEEGWLDRPEEHPDWADPLIRAAAHRPAAGPVDGVRWMVGCGDRDLASRVRSAAAFAATLRDAGAEVLEVNWRGGHEDEDGPGPVSAAAIALMERSTATR